MFDERGEKHGKKSFKRKDTTFKYGKGSYNIDFQNSTYEEDNPIWLGIWKRRSYFYNTHNSNPIKLDKKAEPPISPELYNINLETEVAKKLNDLSKGKLADFITARNVLIALAAGGVFWYLKSTGKI
jgi:hypothetical protein